MKLRPRELEVMRACAERRVSRRTFGISILRPGPVPAWMLDGRIVNELVHGLYQKRLIWVEADVDGRDYPMPTQKGGAALAAAGDAPAVDPERSTTMPTSTAAATEPSILVTERH